MAKWVYMFTEGDATMRNTLGGKGANLAEMAKIRSSGTTRFHNYNRCLYSVL